LAGNPKEETACPEARNKTSTRPLLSALVDQRAEFEANDPIPEAEGIFVRLVSLTARPRLKRARLLRASTGRAGLFGYDGSIQEPLDLPSRRRLATAAPMGTFEVQYAGEDLTVSKYAPAALL
jgi:hypothetical protein